MELSTLRPIDELTGDRRRGEELLEGGSEALRLAERERLRAIQLQAVTAALSRAATPLQVAESVVAEALPVLDAFSGVVALISGACVEIIGAGPVPTESEMKGLEQLRRLPLDAAVPIAEAARSGRLVWIANRAENQARYPAILPLQEELGIHAWGAAPLLVADRSIGAIAFACNRERDLSSDERGFLEAIALLCAQALERARLYYEAESARRRLEEANAALQEETQLRERLMAVLGHDLRNPLGAILLSAENLLGRSPSDVESRSIRRIKTSATRMQGMIEQLLDFAAIRQGGGLHFRPRMSDLCEIARTVIDEMEPAAPATRFELRSSGRVDGVWDPDRLMQLVSNLVGNAVQHGDGRLVTTALQATEDGATMAVHNMGEPISAESLPLLFDPFYRASTRDRTKSQNLGLGLYIAREIVRRHGGTIEVTSTRAEGTALRVWLPLVPPEK